MLTVRALIEKRRTGLSLDKLVDEALGDLRIFEDYGFGELLDEIGATPSLGFVDFSSERWKKLSIEKQMKYASAYQVWYADRSRVPLHIELNYSNSLLTLIPPGKHQDAFWCGTCEVTQEDWEHIVGYNISEKKGKDYPNSSIDHGFDIDKYLEETHSSLLHVSQWYYACRAGTTSDYFWGDKAKPYINDYAWYKDNSNMEIHPVGEKKPNAWGLYDMIGNVHELCRDSYSYRRQIIPTLRMCGACCIDHSEDCKSSTAFAFNDGMLPAYRFLGIRVMRPFLKDEVTT